MTPSTDHPEILLRETVWLRRLAYELAGDAGLADDLVQETWLAASKRRFETGIPPRPWLRRVVRNLAATLRRDTWRRRQGEQYAAATRTDGPQDDRALGYLERLEAQDTVMRAVRGLDEPTQVLLAMRFQEDLSPTEIAQRLGLPPGTVRSQLSRALKQLRGRLAANPRELSVLLMPIFGLSGGEWITQQPGAPSAPPAAPAPAPAADEPAADEVVTESTGVTAGGGWAVGLAVLALGAISVWAWFEGAGAVTNAPAKVSEVRFESPLSSSSPQAPEDGLARAPLPLEFGSAPGWWLEGTLRGPGGPIAGTAQVRVSDAGASGTAARSKRILTGASGRDGKIEIDVSEIMRDPRHRIEQLLVEVDHPDFFPGAQVVALGRSLRQQGFKGLRGRVPVRFVLQPAPHRLQGQVRVPAGFSRKGLVVTCVPQHPTGRPRRGWVDRTKTDAFGRFSLRATGAGRAFVVVFDGERTSARATLRPAHALVRSRRLHDVELRMTAGSSIEGTLDVPGGYCGSRLRIAVRTDRPPESGATRTQRTTLPGLAEMALEATEEVLVASRLPSRELPVAWFGDDYDYVRVSAPVAPDGKFCIGGLREGHDYIVEDPEWHDLRGRRIEALGATASRDVEAPYENLLLPVDSLGCWRITLDGSPLRNCYLGWGRAEDGKLFLGQTDDRGDFAMWCPGDVAGTRVNLQVFGCESQKVTVQPFRRVALQVAEPRNTGDLTVRFIGDDERLIEGWTLLFQPLQGGQPLRARTPRNGLSKKRLDNLQVFRGITTGRYRVTVLPQLRWLTCDFGAFHAPVQFEMEIRRGMNQRTVQVVPGGFAKLPDPGKLAASLGAEGKPLRFCVVRGDGQEIPGCALLHGQGDLISIPRPEKRSDVLPTEGALRLYPMLPAGSYALVLDVGLESPRRVPFSIRAGRETIVGENK